VKPTNRARHAPVNGPPAPGPLRNIFPACRFMPAGIRLVAPLRPEQEVTRSRARKRAAALRNTFPLAPLEASGVSPFCSVGFAMCSWYQIAECRGGQ